MSERLGTICKLGVPGGDRVPARVKTFPPQIPHGWVAQVRFGETYDQELIVGHEKVYFKEEQLMLDLQILYTFLENTAK